MKVRALSLRLFRTQVACVIALWSALSLARTSASPAERVPQPQSASTAQQEGATAELRSTLAGNMKDFSVAADGVGKPDELENALRLDQHLVKTRNQLGLLYLSSGDKVKAENEFRTAILDDAKFVEAKNNLGVLYAWMGKSTEAIALLREALGERPTYAEAHQNLGLVLAGQGKYAEAEKEVRLALRLAPSKLSALSAIGMLEVKLGHREQGVENLRKVAKQEPDSPAEHSNRE